MSSRGRPSATIPRIAAVALVCAAAIGLAACGGDDDSGDSGGSGADAGGTTMEDAGTATEDGAGGQAEDLRARFEQLVRQNLTVNQNYTRAQANCVIDHLQDAISDQELAQVVSGQQSPAVTKAAAEAGRACVDVGGG
jgi:hypothetical protein